MRTKPLAYFRNATRVEAMKYDGANIADVCRWVNESKHDMAYVHGHKTTVQLAIKINGIYTYVNVGCYIIKTENGDIQTCNPIIFEEAYELVEAV